MSKRTQPRGAAAVEMAITMVVLIPLIFYALFLQDFVYYRLNGQETLVAAAFDHVTPDYMKNNPDVGGMNRLKFCDHTAAYDSYERDFECEEGSGGSGGPGGPGVGVSGGSGGLGHHHAVGSHQCWIGGGQELECGVSKGVEVAMLPTATPFMMFFGTDWNRGGMATCSAQLKVTNFIIPRMLSSESGGWLWSKKKLTDRKQVGSSGGGERSGDEWNEGYGIGTFHSDMTGGEFSAQEGPGDGEGELGSWLLSKEEMSVLVDPWALTKIDEIDAHEGGPFLTTFLPPGTIPGNDMTHPLLDRTGNYYNHYAKDAAKAGMDWHSDMVDKHFLDTFSGYDAIGDQLKSVPVTWKKNKPKPGFSGGAQGPGKASGYADSRAPGANRPNKYPQYWGPQSN